MAILKRWHFIFRFYLIGCFSLGIVSAAYADCAHFFLNPAQLAQKNGISELTDHYVRQVEELEDASAAEQAAVRSRHEAYYQTFIEELKKRVDQVVLGETGEQVPWQVSLASRRTEGLGADAPERVLKISLKAAALKDPEIWSDLLEVDQQGNANGILAMTIFAKPLVRYWQEVAMPGDTTLDLFFYDGTLGTAKSAMRASLGIPRDPTRNNAQIVLPTNFFFNPFDSGLRLVHELSHYRNLVRRPVVRRGGATTPPVTREQPDFFSLDEADAYLTQYEQLLKLVDVLGGFDGSWGSLERFKAEVIYHLKDWQRVVPEILRHLNTLRQAAQEALLAQIEGLKFETTYQSIGSMVQAMARCEESYRLKISFEFFRTEADGSKTPLIWEQYIYNPMKFMQKIMQDEGITDMNGPAFQKAWQAAIKEQVLAAMKTEEAATAKLAEAYQASLRQ